MRHAPRVATRGACQDAWVGWGFHKASFPCPLPTGRTRARDVRRAARHDRLMDSDALPRAARGYVTRADLLTHGHDDRDIRAAVRAGVIRRRRRGIYVYADDDDRLNPRQRHVVDIRSVADKLGPSVAVSHQSACAIHDIATYDMPLDLIHVTRLDGATGRREHGLVHHVGSLVADDDLMTVDGMIVVTPARAMLEVAMTGSVESAIVTLDSGLHLAMTNIDTLAAMSSRFASWQGARNGRYALSLADGRAESPGESRSRLLFRRENLPIPDLQVPFHDEDGRLIGRTDFAWLEFCHVGEFDGKVKFGGIAGDTRTPQQIAYAEKRREDRIRRRPVGMSRWGWADLDGAAGRRTASRVRFDLEQSKRLYGRARVIIPLA